MCYRLDYDLEANGLLVIKTMEMIEGPGTIFRCGEGFKYGERRRISKGHSELGTETQRAVWQKPRKKKIQERKCDHHCEMPKNSPGG